MLDTYRRVLTLPGAWRFSAAGLLARLPWAMTSLAIVVYISASTGSYAQAGILSACFQIPAAIGTIVTSRWTDRLGQARMLPWLSISYALFLVLFVVSVEVGYPLLLQAVLIAISGVTMPAVGSMVRARWAHITRDNQGLRSAFALESILDEVVFTLSPLITAALAFHVALPLPLIVCAVLAVAGGLALAVQRRTEPPAVPRGTHGDQPRGGALRQPGLLLVVVGSLGIGGVFGTYEVAVVAFCEQSGSSGATGIVLALWALGSLLAGIVFGARHWNAPLPRQVMLLALLLTVVLIPAPFIGGVVLLTVATTIAGAAVAPALIANFSLTERLVPARLLTEGLTWMNSGLSLGFAGGTSLGGVVIDSFGTTAAFWLPIGCASFALIVAVLGQGTWARATAGSAAESGLEAAPRPPLNPDPIPGPTPGGFLDDPTGRD